MKHRILTFSILLVAVVCPASGQVDQWTAAMKRGEENRLAGDYAKALVSFNDALRLAEASDLPIRVALSANMLGLNCDELGKFLEAEKQYRRALLIVTREKGHRSASVAQILVNLSGVYQHVGRDKEAEAMLREALDIYAAVPLPDRIPLTIARSFLAETLIRKGEYLEAEPLVEQAVEVFGEAADTRHPYLGMALNNLGVIRQHEKRDREATELFERAIAILERELGGGHPLLLYSLNNVAAEYFKSGRLDDAERSYKRALSVAERHLGATHPTCATVAQNYAVCLRKVGRKAEAKTLEARAKAVLRESALSNGAGMTVSALAFH